jgi:hypothetical protein
MLLLSRASWRKDAACFARARWRLPPSPTATLTALAAAGRNPTDLTLPTVGSEAVDPPGGSHEDPGIGGWLLGAVGYAGNVAWELPGAIGQTYESGEMRDSLEGLGASAYDQIFGKPLTWLTGNNWMTDRGSVYGKAEAFQNGRAVGNTTGFVMNAVVTVSGIGGVIQGTITGIRAIKAAGGLIQVAQLLTSTGQAVNVVMVNGQAVVATAETLASLGVSAEAAANLMASANNAGQGGGAPNTMRSPRYGNYVRRVDDFKHPLEAEHVKAALVEKNGGVVKINPATGLPYDHLLETRNAMHGAFDRIQLLKKYLSDPDLPAAMRSAVQSELAELSKMLDNAEQILGELAQ